MSKRIVKSQASSARAASEAFGGTFGQGQGLFRSSSTAFGSAPPSLLSYVYEPPDLTQISDPNAIVAFKNLQKKDGTTKTKALEDLQNFVDSCEKKGIEEGVLEAWIKVYPRTSIDSSRRVRQLAHIFQGRIALSSGKRLAKHMSAIVSSWLAGQQDPDKAVNRAAHDSFNQTFATEEKSKNVWRVYYQAIVGYVENVVVNETESTISDMRTTSPDDAASKYARVAACAVAMLASLMESVPYADMGKSHSTLAALVGDEALWKLANHDDAFVRRAIFRLLITCLDRQPQMLDSSLLSTHILIEGLQNNQMGSSLDFVKALVRLSEAMPTVWTSSYQGMGKKSASSRLLLFLRRGSQGGSVNFWSFIFPLLKLVPDEIVFTPSVASSSEPGDEKFHSHMLPVLDALREGVISKDEPQSNVTSAWTSYLDICDFIAFSAKQYAQSKFLQTYLFPLVHQYIRPSSELVKWAVAGPQQNMICARACEIAFRVNPEISHEEWKVLSSKFVEDFKTSLPEQSKDYITSQDSIAAQALRWYSLQATLLGGNPSEALMQRVHLQLVEENAAAISVLTTRNGKPYGVAVVLRIMVRMMPEFVFNEVSAKNALVSFAENKIPLLMMSPSATYLIQLLEFMEHYVDVGSVYLHCIESVENFLESSAGQTAMMTLLSSPGVAKAGLLTTTANKTLARATADVLRESNQLNSRLLTAALKNPSVPKELTDDVLSILTRGLSIEDSSQPSFRMLDVITKNNKIALSDFTPRSQGSHLLAKLKSLSEGPLTILSEQAKMAMDDIKKQLETGDLAQNTLNVLMFLRSAFEYDNAQGLNLETFVGFAEEFLGKIPAEDIAWVIDPLFFEPDAWTRALEPFLRRSLNPSLGMTNSLGSALMMINGGKTTPLIHVVRDDLGQSTLLWFLRSISELIPPERLSMVSEDRQLRLLHYVAVTLQLVNDEESIPGSIGLWMKGDWATDDLATEYRIAESIAKAKLLLSTALQAAPMSRLTSELLAILLQESEGLSSWSYYHARAYLAVLDIFSESERQTLIGDSADRIKAIHKSPNIFADMAVLMSCDRKEAAKPCNELLSRLTDDEFGLEDAKSQQDVFRQLLLMNCLLRRSDEMVHDIPQHRLVFYVQHVIGHVGSILSNVPIEIIRSLAAILPAMRTNYGSFWGKALDIMETVQKFPLDDTNLMGYYACFKLCATLAKPNMLEANDDLLEAWNDRKPSIMEGAITLLGRTAPLKAEIHHPQDIFVDLLGQLLEGCDQLSSEEMSTLYAAIYCKSATYQRTAFQLLHVQIPRMQEQLSLDRALSKDHSVKLPDDLLSMIRKPRKEDLPISEKDPMTAPLRTYLFSWVLVFDHWKNASNTLQGDYAECLTEGKELLDFLDLAFNILIGQRDRVVDISKLDIETCTVDVDSPELETRWLLCHLYFLCLKHLPTQTRGWWLDQAPRRTKLIVESWTQKYISKHIIASDLNTVREWSPSQINDDQPLIIKVLPAASEITASISVDGQSMELVIRLPPSYPFARAEVEGVNRVAVPEKEWISWIRDLQGRLGFLSEGGGNALIDTLLAWRKYVAASLKGKTTECAICYSVLATDRSLPSTVCKTCKNKFHGSCLWRWFNSSGSSSCPLCRNTIEPRNNT